MNTAEKEDKASLDAAILECNHYSETQQSNARKAMMFAILVFIGTVSLIFLVLYRPSESPSERAADALIALAKVKASFGEANPYLSPSEAETSKGGKPGPNEDRSAPGKISLTLDNEHPKSDPTKVSLEDIGKIEQAQLADTGSHLTTAAVTAVAAVLSVIVALLISLYRFHSTEVARTQHYKFGFMRIRIAANNTSEASSLIRASQK